jgi:hypothetical protein
LWLQNPKREQTATRPTGKQEQQQKANKKSMNKQEASMNQ